LLGVVVSEWKAREDARRRKEEAEALTVKYKVKSHNMDTQEEIDEVKFRAMFPDFFKLYSDLDDVCILRLVLCSSVNNFRTVMTYRSQKG
jgi:hypothetical protein